MHVVFSKNDSLHDLKACGECVVGVPLRFLSVFLMCSGGWIFCDMKLIWILSALGELLLVWGVTNFWVGEILLVKILTNLHTSISNWTLTFAFGCKTMILVCLGTREYYEKILIFLCLKPKRKNQENISIIFLRKLCFPKMIHCMIWKHVGMCRGSAPSIS